MALTIEINHAKTRARAAAAGQPVVPQAVKGRIRRIKWFVLLLTLSIYYVTPFLRWDRGPNAPDQALLLDFVHGRLYFFFVEIWPQDLYLVTGLLVLASTILILTNALAGRLWCGFACPQTVWTDLFLLVERLIEGDRRQRLKNLGAPLDAKRGDADRRKAFCLAVDLARYRRHADLLLHRRAGTAAKLCARRRLLPIRSALDRRVRRHHLRPGRFRARTGLYVHVSAAAPSRRDLGSGCLYGQLPGLPRRARTSAKKAADSACRASRRETASTAISASRCVHRHRHPRRTEFRVHQLRAVRRRLR